MWATSAAFDVALATTPRRVATRVDVLQAGLTVTTLDVVMEGSITAEDEKVRRSGTVRLIDPQGTLTPVTARDLLAPRGTELRIYKGLYLPGVVQPEMVPLGTLRISAPQIRRTNSGVEIDVKGYDRARAIQRSRFTAPWVIPAGTVITTAISDIITTRSTYPVNITPSTSTTPALVFEALADPWDAISQLAASIGYEVFFDLMGTFVARPTPDYSAQTAAWAYAKDELTLLLHSTREMTDDDAYSGVIVTSEGPDAAPIRVAVWDTDPNSPTYYDPAHPELSVFGPVPYGFSSPIITTSPQATLAGQTVLARVAGLAEDVTVETLGHFGHDVNDVVAVDDPDVRLAGTHRIQSITQPIRRGPMTIKMRTRRATTV